MGTSRYRVPTVGLMEQRNDRSRSGIRIPLPTVLSSARERVPGRERYWKLQYAPISPNADTVLGHSRPANGSRYGIPCCGHSGAGVRRSD